MMSKRSILTLALIIAKVLTDVGKRGVHIEVVLDRSQKSQKYSSADFVENVG
jgi:hypothetical protein